MDFCTSLSTNSHRKLSSQSLDAVYSSVSAREFKSLFHPIHISEYQSLRQIISCRHITRLTKTIKHLLCYAIRVLFNKDLPLYQEESS